MRGCRESIAGAVLMIAATCGSHGAGPLAVDVTNASQATLCAEKDNVYIKLQSTEVRRFTVEAAHPAYIGTMVRDRWAPDFTNCDMSSDPVFKFQKRRLTIYETEEWQLVGLTFPSFWRPNRVPVRVGDRIETGFHLLQLWTRYQERAEEVLVLYPADGNWRARPLPPQNLRWSAYGSSFQIGPLENDGRPFVDIREIVFDPERKTFTLSFVRGGSATLRLDKLDQERIALDVTLSAPIAGGPFVALRSMYVTEINADTARISWQAKDKQGWMQSNVMEFKHTTATELWAGRVVPSRHNTSAPDMLFGNFQ